MSRRWLPIIHAAVLAAGCGSYRRGVLADLEPKTGYADGSPESRDTFDGWEAGR